MPRIVAAGAVTLTGTLRMCSIRRTRYGSFEHPITLAFFSGIEGHPELIDEPLRMRST